MDDRIRLDPRRYPFYRHSQAAFFLAHESGRPVGRLAVMDNRLYNDYNRAKTAFFYLFECENDPAAAQGLFSAAFEWAKSRGLTEMLGLKGFTVLDGFGLLVKGFEHRPAFGLPYNPPYYIDLIESVGFAPVLPFTSERLHQFFGYETPLFCEQYVQEISGLQPGQKLNPPEPLFTKCRAAVRSWTRVW